MSEEGPKQGRVPQAARTGSNDSCDGYEACVGKAYRCELRSYLWGLGLTLCLTLLPFGLVHWSALPLSSLLYAILACAVVQVVVHFRFFLHVDLSKQRRDDLNLILFSALIFVILVGGTIWILSNLYVRMG